MKKKKYFLTSAIPYVNAAPHIGHALEFLQADVVRRHRILLGDDVTYLTGADENALKIVQAAETAKQETQAFTDIHQASFTKLAKHLNVQIDVWQRGTDPKHTPSSQKLWKLCDEAGDIYKKSYTGLYCVGCETFYTREELDENGECFEHPGKPLEDVSEENYFFKLSKYQSYLEKLITSDTLKITPEKRRNEALAFIRQGLEDFSISRSQKRAKGWGVPVPNDDSQIMYVWFDALNIYQTGIGFGSDETSFQKWAPQNLMIIGKGIIRFHAIYWPAILRSANLPIPKELFVHGYLTVDGRKMSKSIGNVVDPIEEINDLGVDPLRYYLLAEIPSTSDGDYSRRRFKELYNADLANGLGNLVSRLGKLAEGKSLNITTPSYKSLAIDEFESAMESYRFHDAALSIRNHISDIDKYLNEKAPWKLSGKEQDEILEHAITQLVHAVTLLQPFIPHTAQTILKQFTAPIIKTSEPLFPRIT